MQNNIRILMLACVVNGMSFSMILPLLAPLVRELQLTELQAGAMVSVGSLLMTIAALYIGQRQTQLSVYALLALGFVGMSLTWAIFAAVLLFGLWGLLTGTLLFAGLMLARASTGIFMAMPQIALQSYVMTHELGAERRAQSMAKFGALGSLGMIIGPLATAMLLQFGMLSALWAAILLLAMLSLYIVFAFQRKLQPIAVTATQLEQAQEHINTENLNLKRILPWLALGFSLYFAIVTLNLTAGFYLQDQFKIAPATAALYFSQCALIAAVSLVAMQILIAKYLKWSVRRLLWVGLAFMLFGLAISLFSEQLRIFQAAYICYGLSIACLTPAFTTGAAQHAALHLQAKIAAWCTATQALSFVIGPILSTGLYQLAPSYPYVALLIIMLVLGLYFAWTKIR